MTWWKVFADGSEYDIVCAASAEEAIEYAKWKHGTGAVWTVRPY
jgi:hypothetical protein